MRTKRAVNFERIEEEFGSSAKEITLDLRNGPPRLSWPDVAGCLDVPVTTLYNWRKLWGIGYDGIVRYPVPEKDVDQWAREKCYEDLPDTIRDLKLNHKMTEWEMAAYIGVGRRQISVNTPPELRGIQNISEVGRKRMREKHPWNFGI